MPVKAALTPPTGLNKPFLGEDVEPKAVDSAKATPENPYRRGAKGMERNTRYYTLKVNLIYMHLTTSYVPKKLENRNIFV